MSTKQVNTKEEFQAKQKQMEQEFRKPKKNPKFKVTPNLTPRGKDILMRLNNKSLNVNGDKSYTENEDMVNARFMSKHELIAAAKKNNEKIEGLKNTLNETSNKLTSKLQANDD